MAYKVTELGGEQQSGFKAHTVDPRATLSPNYVAEEGLRPIALEAEAPEKQPAQPPD